MKKVLFFICLAALLVSCSNQENQSYTDDDLTLKVLDVNVSLVIDDNNNVVNLYNPREEPCIVLCHWDWSGSFGHAIVRNPSGTIYHIRWNDSGDTTNYFADHGGKVYQSTYMGVARTYCLVDITEIGYDCHGDPYMIQG